MATNLFTTTATDWTAAQVATVPDAKFDTFGMPNIANKANAFLSALGRVAGRMHKFNLYERSEANRSDCLGMFGADDIAGHVKEYSTAYHMEYPRHNAAYKFYRSRQMLYFYNCTRILALYFYRDELATTYFPMTPTTNDMPKADNYNAIVGSNDSRGLGLEFSEFWRNPLGTGERYATDTNNRRFINDANNVWCGDYVWRPSTANNSGRSQAINDFLNTITCWIKHDQLCAKLCACLPTSQGGDDESSDNYIPKAGTYMTQATFAERATKFFTLLPCKICQIRQVLASVMLNSKYGTDAWQPWTYAGQVQVSIAVQEGLSARGFINAEIEDATIDPSKNSLYYDAVSDPLVIAGTGYGAVADTVASELAHLTPIVSLRRRYMFKPYCGYYDYPELSNTNAFEQKYGKVRYGLSNLRSYLNNTSKTRGGWAIASHNADAFASTASNCYGYLNHISVILRNNIAKCEQLYPFGDATSIVNNTCAVGLADDWVSIPNMTQLGYSNYSGTRKAARIAVDDKVHGEYYLLGEYGEIDGSEDSFCAEDNWRPAMSTHQYYKFGYNPNFSVATSATTIYVPTRTPANSSSDGYDATISNRVACITTAGDGSANLGTTTYYPWFLDDACMVYFCLAAFHADKIDPSLPSEHIHGATLKN